MLTLKTEIDDNDPDSMNLRGFLFSERTDCHLTFFVIPLHRKSGHRYVRREASAGRGIRGEIADKGQRDIKQEAAVRDWMVGKFSYVRGRG